MRGIKGRGFARKDSDIDLLAVFEKVDEELRKSVCEIERSIERNMERERRITLVTSSFEDFQKEKIPLYTAIRQSGV